MMNSKKSHPKFKAKQVVASIRKNRGLISLVAKELGCDRMTIYNYVERHPTVKSALIDAREGILDVAEGRLFEKIQEGSEKSIFFTLETLGKHRGYTRRQEVTGKDGGALEVESTISISAIRRDIEQKLDALIGEEDESD